MNLGHGTLEDWLKKPPSKSLKKGGDNFPFYGRYESFKHYLNLNLHNEVTKAAILVEVKKKLDFDKITWLNDHGPEHIKTVIQRASQLIDSQHCDLNAREVFILLNAIQVHDVGNFYGRYGHEINIIKAIKDGLSPFDDKEVKLIKDIAEVHGGSYQEDNGSKSKNTFKKILSPTNNIDSYPIRLHLLASILRFADELADDKHRADSKGLKEKTMPKGSEIYHAYAQCLDPAIINFKEKRVELHYFLENETLSKKYGKYDKASDKILKVNILEEIYDRTLKIHFERIYCSKFWKKEIDIESIWVKIEFYSKKGYSEGHQSITYTLSDSEYPLMKSGFTIFDLCPKELCYPNGEKITTKNVLKTLKLK